MICLPSIFNHQNEQFPLLPKLSCSQTFMQSWLVVVALTQRDSGRNCSAIDPEGHPGQHDHQSGREVGLEQEEEDVSP